MAMSNTIRLEDHALLRLPALSAATGARHESGACGMLENLTDTLVGLGGALKVLVGADLLANLLTLLGRNRLLASLPQLLNSLLVVTQILLASNEDDRQTLAEVQNLGDPLLLNVVKGVRRVNSEADQNDMRVGVRERAKTVVILLASSIPKGQLNVLAIDFDIGDVVLEDGGDVDLNKTS
jgi:hypothetical protein